MLCITVVVIKNGTKVGVARNALTYIVGLPAAPPPIAPGFSISHYYDMLFLSPVCAHGTLGLVVLERTCKEV